MIGHYLLNNNEMWYSTKTNFSPSKQGLCSRLPLAFQSPFCTTISKLCRRLSSLTPGARRKDPYTGFHTIDGRSYVPPVEDGFRIGVKRLASGIVRTVVRAPVWCIADHCFGGFLYLFISPIAWREDSLPSWNVVASLAPSSPTSPRSRSRNPVQLPWETLTGIGMQIR